MLRDDLAQHDLLGEVFRADNDRSRPTPGQQEDRGSGDRRPATVERAFSVLNAGREASPV
jgi:hypothetical protein